MKKEFKVGDRVRVVKQESEVLLPVGFETTIRTIDIDVDYPFELEGDTERFYCDDDIELIAESTSTKPQPEPKVELKVGDRVLVKVQPDAGCPEVGYEGVVSKVGKGVKLNYGIAFDGDTLFPVYYSIDELELIPESTEAATASEPSSEPSIFETTALALGKLVTEKNQAYGDSVANSSEIFKLLYPNGIVPSQYADMLLMVRTLDKLSRIATDRDALGESPWGDIAGYALLGQVRVNRERTGKNPE